MPDRAMIRAMTLPADARVGFYGKLPARGDFLREGLPRDFTDRWDAWWQQGLAATQTMAGEAWRDSWLEAPVWRFVLPPGVCGRDGVIGLWMPSVDKAGRFFPLTIAAIAAVDWPLLAGKMIPFLAAAEQAGRDALEFDLLPTELTARLQAAMMAVGTSAEDDLVLPAGMASWWTEGGTRVAAHQAHGMGLPTGQAFAALIDDAWGPTRADTAGQPGGG